LAAPQAGLMAAVAQGIFNHNLEWTMINTGIGVAILCVIIDEYLKKRGHRLPVLAVGLGIYLPLDSSVPLVIGGFLSYFIMRSINKRYVDQPEKKQTAIQKGLLLCCGLVAGASVMGVLLAIPFALKQSAEALSIMPANLAYLAGPGGLLVTILLCLWIYRVVIKR
jgi:putative OPT family oligopeptide transporter